MPDQTTILIVLAGVFFLPPIIEMLGPVEGDKEQIRRAKRQISTILSNALAALVALQQSGFELNDQTLVAYLAAGIAGKVGIQAMHDGYWKDKNVPQLRRAGADGGGFTFRDRA